MWIESYRINGEVIAIRVSEVVAVTDAPRMSTQGKPAAEILLRTSGEPIFVSESRETIINKVNTVYDSRVQAPK